jgi:acetyl esterase
VAIRTEANFLSEYAGLPDDLEVLPGVTVRQGRELLARPVSDPPGASFVPSVAYSSAAGDVGQMALYTRADPAERVPIVAFVHGGGWASGHHYGALRYAHPLAARGYVTATFTYRLADEAPWPASLEDTKCAVRWLRRHAHDLGGDPDRIVLCGDSAGGHLAAMTALTPGSYEGDGGWETESSRVSGVFLVHPAVDLPAMVDEGHYPPAAGYFGDDLAAASPVNQVNSQCPPVLTVTGDADRVVPVAHVQRFHRALAEAGVPERLEVLPGRDHGFDLGAGDFARCGALLQEFVVSTLGTARSSR